jgi:hypothetical protein
MLSQFEPKALSNYSQLNAKRMQATEFPPLETVSKPVLTTKEIAYYLNQSTQTWRAHACHETYPEGLRPIRIGNRLNWPTDGVKKLIGVAV